MRPRPRPRWWLALACLVAAPLAAPAAAPPARVPVVVDTDAGGAADDALGLALLLSDPAIELRGVTTVHGDAHTRALLACRLLAACGRAVPVAAGSAPRAVPDFEG